MTIAFDATVTQDYEAGTRREWLEANGLGGWASGTISGAHTRRYHGLLVAATRPPLGRMPRSGPPGRLPFDRFP